MSIRRTGSAKFTEWGREAATQFRRDRDLLLHATAQDIVDRILGPASAPLESVVCTAPHRALPDSTARGRCQEVDRCPSGALRLAAPS